MDLEARLESTERELHLVSGLTELLCAAIVIVCLPQSKEKEQVNEEQITRLQSRVEQMVKEAEQRLKAHVTEKRVLMEEKVRRAVCCDEGLRDGGMPSPQQHCCRVHSALVWIKCLGNCKSLSKPTSL